MGFFNQPSRQFDKDTGLLKGYVSVNTNDGIKYYPKGKRNNLNYELDEEQYQDLVKKKTSKVDITNIPQSDADPKGTRFVKQTAGAFHNLAYENPELTGLLSGTARFMSGIGEDLKQSAQDPNETDIGKRLLGTFVTAEDWTIQQSAKGAQMWATGADIYNPWTKEQIGSLPDLNIDPTLASVAGGAAAAIVTGSFTDKGISKINKATDVLATSSQLQPVGLLAESAYIAQKTDGPLVSNVFASITKKTKASQAYKDWDEGAEKWLEAHRGQERPMTGYPHFVDPDTGVRYRKGYEASKDTLGNVNMDLRKIRDSKRYKKTLIPREEVARIMKKYNQPPEMVDMFMEYQKAGKKKIDATIEKINERILKARETNPDAYPGVKASLGHGRAADRYEHSADMLSNIDLENFFINVKRSNLDEVSDPFNRALGRSLDLDEEILKFVDKDLGKLFGGYGLHRTQIDASIKYVRKNMNKKINWKSIVTDTGEQLFKSKEEFLINEALQKAHKLK